VRSTYLRSAYARSVYANFAPLPAGVWKFQHPPCMTQNFLRRAPSGKLKTAATAAFLGVCARYRQKAAICCADDTIGGGAALIRDPPAGDRS